jgi:hypothetical protein
MKIEKEKRRVNIICKDGSLVTGILHINPGERMLDFLNDRKETFVPVTEAEVCTPDGSRDSRLVCEKKNTIILSKSAIKLVEEL